METVFFRLLSQQSKAASFLEEVQTFRRGEAKESFTVDPVVFHKLPGCAFIYWIDESTRAVFNQLPAFENETRFARAGLQTNDDFRWLRLWYEQAEQYKDVYLVPFSKGSSNGMYFSSFELSVRWGETGRLMKVWKAEQLRQGLITANNSKCWNEHLYGRTGITWPTRPHKRGDFSHMPPNCVFSITGMGLFCEREEHWSLIALLNSDAYSYLLHLLMPRGALSSGQTLKYEAGYVTSVPLPNLSTETRNRLAALAHEGWSLSRKIDSTREASRNFILPSAIAESVGYLEQIQVKSRLSEIAEEANSIATKVYGLNAAQIALALNEDESLIAPDEDDSDTSHTENRSELWGGVGSWAVGAAFGRFDWRLATGEREVPPEPDPFDPLPAKSPGMLPDRVEPFHMHLGILVDDPGHPHDLADLVEDVLARVDIVAADNVRRWLRRDFFPFHLQRYSKSRRKAPIYWPLATVSGSYTLWVYYPSLTSQTLYTAINDFIEPKLKQVGGDLAALRNKGSARTRDDERRFESLQGFELELIELRDTLLKLAPTYKPNHDDGVQITAAPLWPLFRHKPWQKVLKDTWAKLEKGDYDWAHLAMSYWPERVRDKCKTDKSLAIAHGLEDLYIEPEAKPNKARGRKKTDSGDLR